MKKILGIFAGAFSGLLIAILIQAALSGIALSDLFGMWSIIGSVLGGILGFAFPDRVIRAFQGLIPY
ncbi:MAG: hypothetical protein ABJQ29_05465 [Luteolibacter sp.]